MILVGSTTRYINFNEYNQMVDKKRIKSILIGMTIGDGSLYVRRDIRSKTGFHQRLQIRHSIKQIEYTVHKAKLIKELLGGNIPTVTKFNNSGYPGVRFCKSNRWFRYLYNFIYIEGKKTFTRKMLDFLTPEAIAIWYMDNGGLSLKKRNGKIHARELFLNTHISKEENQIIINYFKEIWNIEFKAVLNNKSYRLRCGTKEALKFTKIIKPFIIPSMFYKIDFKY